MQRPRFRELRYPPVDMNGLARDQTRKQNVRCERRSSSPSLAIPNATIRGRLGNTGVLGCIYPVLASLPTLPPAMGLNASLSNTWTEQFTEACWHEPPSKTDLIFKSHDMVLVLLFMENRAVSAAKVNAQFRTP